MEHDPFGHEVEAVITFSGKDRKPNTHPVSTAVQPEGPMKDLAI